MNLRRAAGRAAALAGALLTLAPAARAQLYPGEESSATERWDSTTLEATAVLGEFLYENHENAEAQQMFRDSLGTSTKLVAPQGGIVALDLYRTAQLELREGDTRLARHHLELLVGRYAGTGWARRGEMLLRSLPAEDREEEKEDNAVPAAPDLVQPENVLSRLQAELRADKGEAALDTCAHFLDRYPSHPAADEVRLAQGALLLANNDPAQASHTLEGVARGAKNAAAQAKARYLLGFAYLLTGDRDALAAAVPDRASSGDRWSKLSLVWRGLSEEREGRWKSAGPMLKQALQGRYDSPATAYALAALAADESHLGRGESSQWMRDASRQARQHKLGSLGEYTQLTLGHLLMGQRRFADAAKAYEEFQIQYAESPDAPAAAYQGAMAWKKSGNEERATRAFAQLAQRYPRSDKTQDAYLQMGQIYADKGNVGQAVEAYRQMGRASGSDKDSMLLIAKVHYNRKEFDRAIPVYLKFLQESPDDSRAYEVQDLLLSSYWLGKRDDPGLERAVEQYPNHPVVPHIRWAMGAKAYKAKDYQAAERQFQRILQDFPKSTYAPGSLFFQGECLAQSKDYSGAADVYRKLSAYPKSQYTKQAAFRLGLVLFQAGDFQGAADAYQRYKPGANDPLAADAVFNRALALDKAGMKPEAMAAYEALLARHPKYPQASWVWFQLGTMHEAQGDYGTAAQAYARVGAGTERVQALYNRGICLERLRQRNVARKTYEELRLARPADNPYRLKGLLRLAIIYELASDKRAPSLYREVARLSRDPAVAGVASKRLGQSAAATIAAAESEDSSGTGAETVVASAADAQAPAEMLDSAASVEKPSAERTLTRAAASRDSDAAVSRSDDAPVRSKHIRSSGKAGGFARKSAVRKSRASASKLSASASRAKKKGSDKDFAFLQ